MKKTLFLVLPLILFLSVSCEEKLQVGSEIHSNKPILATHGDEAENFLPSNTKCEFTYSSLDEFKYYVDNGQIAVVEPWMTGVVISYNESDNFAIADFPDAKGLKIYLDDLSVGKAKQKKGYTSLSKFYTIKKLYHELNVCEDVELRAKPSSTAPVIESLESKPIIITPNHRLYHSERNGDWFKVCVIYPTNSYAYNKAGWIHSSKIDTLYRQSVLNLETKLNYSILERNESRGEISVLCKEKNPSRKNLYYLSRYIYYSEPDCNLTVNIYATEEALKLLSKVRDLSATKQESVYFGENWLYSKHGNSYYYKPGSLTD